MPTLIEKDLKRSDFEYTLPPERIAQSPVTPRDQSRLMVLNRSDASIQHQRFNQIGAFLRPGDVLVMNATRVFPARLRGQKRSGGKIELLFMSPSPWMGEGRDGGETARGAYPPPQSSPTRGEEANRWRALVRGASVPGTELLFNEGLTARLETRLENGEWIVGFSREAVREFLERHGEMPLPPYIKRSTKNPIDNETYQTVYARAEGSIAAPTAGFHFTPDLLAALRAKGVLPVEIILHVGWGTFRPVRAEKITEHRMLPEFYEMSEKAAEQLTAARRDNRRIIAVGTTAVRTLESVYDAEQARFQESSGATNLFIYPGYRFKAIDGLVTNFHLPHSTPLLLASAFYGGPEPFSLRNAYQEAIREAYRFYSYGDAMFIQ